MTTSEERLIRDFIYLDAAQLYSLYAQVFKGVAERVAKSYMNELAGQDTQEGRLSSGEALEERVTRGSFLTENKVLHDYMYSRLEQSLEPVIWDSRHADADNPLDDIRYGMLVRAHGPAEIEDYEKLAGLVRDFNQIGAAVGYMRTGGALGQIDAAIEALEKQGRSADRNQKATLKRQIQTMRDMRDHLESEALSGLRQDEKFMKSLHYFLTTFGLDNFEISITPSENMNDVLFRGVLDTEWLRLSPDYLRALYGGIVEANWTMVGQLTFIPSESNITEVAEVHGIEEEKLDDIEGIVAADGEQAATQKTAMRDAYRNVALIFRQFERMFFQSNERTELMVRPLAIYQEISIPAGEIQEVG